MELFFQASLGIGKREAKSLPVAVLIIIASCMGEIPILIGDPYGDFLS
jgi:hypothetical protein